MVFFKYLFGEEINKGRIEKREWGRGKKKEASIAYLGEALGIFRRQCREASGS